MSSFLPAQPSYFAPVAALPPGLEGSSGDGPNYGLNPLGPASAMPLFDTFWQDGSRPQVPGPSVLGVAGQTLRHPVVAWRLWRKSPDFSKRLMMLNALYQGLDAEGKTHLNTLLQNTSVLDDTSAEDGQSTLYHLYAMRTTPRADGLDPVVLLRETLRVLHQPYSISQRFAPLTEETATPILAVRNNMLEQSAVASKMPYNLLSLSREKPPLKELNWEDLNVRSATCVSASVMYKLADRQPAELVRQLNGLTSPLQGFYRRINLSNISSDGSEAAIKILKEKDIDFVQTNNPDEVQVKVSLPTVALLRARNDQKDYPDSRSAVETAFQSAYTFLVTNRTYDPATDFRRDAPDYKEESKGLVAQEKELMEDIALNRSIESVNYQVIAGNPQAEQTGDTNAYLYGYRRTFDQITNDIVQALKQKESVITGFIYTEDNGSIPPGGGHEITLVGAFVDKDGEIQFQIVDTDDGNPKIVTKSARELIPRIHHVGLPRELARQVNHEMNGLSHYYIPSPEDHKHFDAFAYSQNPLPADYVPENHQDTQPPSQASPQQSPQAPVVQQQPGSLGINPPYTVGWIPQWAPSSQWVPSSALGSSSMTIQNSLQPGFIQPGYAKPIAYWPTSQ